MSTRRFPLAPLTNPMLPLRSPARQRLVAGEVGAVGVLDDDGVLDEGVLEGGGVVDDADALDDGGVLDGEPADCEPLLHPTSRAGSSSAATRMRMSNHRVVASARLMAGTLNPPDRAYAQMAYAGGATHPRAIVAQHRPAC